MKMTLFYSHQDRHHSLIGLTRFPVAFPSRQLFTKRLHVFARRLRVRISAGFNILHQAIVTAKSGRAQREPMFHEIPQQPLILGDKWNF
jgi:hypothetical protein